MATEQGQQAPTGSDDRVKAWLKIQNTGRDQEAQAESKAMASTTGSSLQGALYHMQPMLHELTCLEASEGAVSGEALLGIKAHELLLLSTVARLSANSQHFPMLCRWQGSKIICRKGAPNLQGPSVQCT